VLLVKVIADPDGNSILFSAGTDGRLAVWNVTILEEDKAIDPLGSLLIHQSGINSLDCQWTDLDRMLILTGGDDNALICTQIEISCERSLLTLIDQQKQFPHAAQISGNAKRLNSFIFFLKLCFASSPLIQFKYVNRGGLAGQQFVFKRVTGPTTDPLETRRHST
jgi:WD40 repeat protein